MKCYVTLSSILAEGDQKLVIYGSREGIRYTLLSLGKESVLTHVDMVEDKEKETNV